MQTDHLLIAATSVVVAILGGGGSVYASEYMEARRETAQMVAIADQLAADPAWTLTDERIADREVFRCGDRNGCSEVHRVWSTRDNLTPEDLHELVEESEWRLEVTADDPLHRPQPSTHRAEGVLNGYEVTLSIRTDINRPDEIDLFISRAK